MKIFKNRSQNSTKSPATHTHTQRERDNQNPQRENLTMFKKTLSLFISFLIISQIIFFKNNSVFKKLEHTVKAEDNLSNFDPVKDLYDFDPTKDIDTSVPNEPSSYEDIKIVDQEITINLDENNFMVNGQTHNKSNKGINLTSDANATGKIKITGNDQENTTPIQIKLSGVDLKPTTGSPIFLENKANVILRVEGDSNLEPAEENWSAISVSEGNTVSITSYSEKKLVCKTKNHYSGGSACIGGTENASTHNHYNAGTINIFGNINLEANSNSNNYNYGPGIGGGYCGSFTSINIGGNSLVTSSSSSSDYNYASGIGEGRSSGKRGEAANINIGGNATVIASSSATSDNGGAGIGKGGENSGYIEAINIGGNATVTASSSGNSNYSSGIGAAKFSNNVKAINIGGNVTVTSSFSSKYTNYCAGIGGGYNGTFENINIGGNATVTATANDGNTNYGAGIGRGYNSGIDANVINIGGNATVTASNSSRSENFGAGIGGGYSGGSVLDVINIGGNATVTAKSSGVTKNDAAGIGGGYNNNTIDAINIGGNATVIASSINTDQGFGYSGSGIGGGNLSSVRTINIGGNTVVVASNTSFYIEKDLRIYNTGIGGSSNSSCSSISITGGFIIASSENKDRTIAQDDIGNADSLSITGGSVYCVNGKMSNNAKDADDNPVYPCYCPKSIENTDLFNKKMSVPLENQSHYKAMAFNEKIKKLLSDNGLTDMFPQNDLSACLYLPEKNYHDQIRASGVSSKIFKSNVTTNKASYKDNPGPDNWLVPSSSEIIPPVIDENIPPPEVDPPPRWYNVKDPPIRGKGIKDYNIVVKEGSSIIGETSVEENNKWETHLNDMPDSRKTVEVFQVDEFFQKSSKGVSETLNIDSTKPVGKITIGSNVFEGFLNAVSFGTLCKDRVHVEIFAEDNLSGVHGVEYALSNTAIEKEEDVLNLEFKNAGNLNNNTATLSFDPNDGYSETEFNKSFFVYAKIIDAAGNRFYLNSDSITIYEELSRDKSYIRLYDLDKLPFNGEVLRDGESLEVRGKEGNDGEVYEVVRGK